ncbi:GntR family transcriptional regulator [Saccharospirillum mangrovi]|uniref:GntR family transcriptional regulator n=1 Tax=Saccharospirillum mangrovi TaxID=2161747 RepID=UPI000D33D0E6|nr:FCD domain-containing protein [Saccharospirillum mangrovi]
MTELTLHIDEDLPLYEQLRNALIYGSYEPGQKLKIDLLKRDFSAGQNAIREALVRLSVEGLVIAEDQKGFRVAPAGLDELKDLAYMRNLLEAEAVGRSIDVGDLEWEGRVAAAMRKLNRTEEALLNNDASVELWTRYDQEFHLALMSACGSKLMIRTYQDLFIKYRQYVVRELKTQGFRGREIIAEHLAIGEAALARDKAKCLALLSDHANTYLNRQLKQERH